MMTYLARTLTYPIEIARALTHRKPIETEILSVIESLIERVNIPTTILVDLTSFFVNMSQNIRSLDARQQFSCQIQNIVDISNFQTNFHGEPIHNYALI